MTRPGSLVPGLVLAASAGAAWWWWPRDEVAAPVVDPVPAAAPAPAAVVPAGGETVPSAPPPAAPAASPGLVKFPDGSSAAALNGVTAEVTLVWNDRPYSPIKQKIVDRGWEWYVHEDGSHSTVRMVEVNGVLAPIGIVASPTESLPVLEDLEKSLGQQLPGRK